MTDRPIATVLVVQTGFLGDAVLATGMLRALHDAGVATVGMLVRADVADVIDGHPALARLHVLDKREKGSTPRMIAELRAAGYDAALVAHRSMRSALIARRAGIAVRIGFRQSELALAHTERVHWSLAAHELERNASLVRRLGLHVDAASARSWLVPREAALEAMRMHERSIVVAPGSVWATKRWREEGFVEVVARLREAGERVVLVGGAGDRELCERIASASGLDAAQVLAGRLSLAELVALSSLARRAIVNDSAPLHIAEAVGTPVTAMFGPTVPEIGFGPTLDASVALGIELPCRPCRIHGGSRCPIGTHECMKAITPDEVLATLADNPTASRASSTRVETR